MRLSVPVHGNQPLKAGLLNHLMKLAGIAEIELFIDFNLGVTYTRPKEILRNGNQVVVVFCADNC